MKVKSLIVLISISISLTIFAGAPVQTVSAQDMMPKYGEDSVNCVQNLSLYRESYKQWKASKYKSPAISHAMKPDATRPQATDGAVAGAQTTPGCEYDGVCQPALCRAMLIFFLSRMSGGWMTEKRDEWEVGGDETGWDGFCFRTICKGRA